MSGSKTLYFTDGDKVVVTDSILQVKNAVYPLDKIYSHKVSIIPPQRISSTILMCLGILAFVFGAVDLLPFAGSTSFLGLTVMTNVAVMAVGIMVLLDAMLLMFQLKEKYLVSLSTSNGEETVIVSAKRDYVYKVIDALNHAYLDIMKRDQIEQNETITLHPAH